MISSWSSPVCSKCGHWVSPGSRSQGLPGRPGPAANGPSALSDLAVGSLWAAEGLAEHAGGPGHLAGALPRLRETPGPQQHFPHLGRPAGLRRATVHLRHCGSPWEGEPRLPAQGRPPQGESRAPFGRLSLGHENVREANMCALWLHGVSSPHWHKALGSISL